jgi:hypothetical protein
MNLQTRAEKDYLRLEGRRLSLPERRLDRRIWLGELGLILMCAALLYLLLIF